MHSIRRAKIFPLSLILLWTVFSSCQGTGADIPVTGVSVSPLTHSLIVGTTVVLKATISPSKASDKGVVWTSQAENIATVTNKGVVTGVGSGQTTITVRTDDGGYSATCVITVTAEQVGVTGISIPATLSLVHGSAYELVTTITPANATNQEVTWATSNAGIAVVDNGMVTGVYPGTATITVTTDDGDLSDTCEVTVTAIRVTGVNLPDTAGVRVGGTAGLIATVSPLNATNKAVTWTSSDELVATVNNSGVVTGISAGMVTITVSTGDGAKTDTCTVSVSTSVVVVTGVSLRDATLDIDDGESIWLTTTVSPTNATNQALTWATSNAGIASVDNGMVTGISPGTATITATTVDGDKTDTCVVTVKAIRVTGVSLSESAGVLLVGGTISLRATVLPEDATNRALNWSSSNPDVASVGSSGTVTGLAAGTSIISVITVDGSYIDTFEVEVMASTIIVPVTSVSIPALLSLEPGEYSVLTAGITPLNATNKKVTWTTDASEVAIVSNGIVTGISPGTANITVTTDDGDYTDSCTVTVTAIRVTSVAVDRVAAGVLVGGVLVLNATVLPANATNNAVVWSSSSPDVATVDSSGKVSGKSVGTTIITASVYDGDQTFTASCTIEVTALVHAVTGVSLLPATLDIFDGDSAWLLATVTPSNATNQALTWTSSDISVATIGSNGRLSALDVGETTITVTTEDGGFSDTCAVRVSAAPLTGVSLSPATISVQKGAIVLIAMAIAPVNAVYLDFTSLSTDVDIVDIYAQFNGGLLIEGTGVGTATVTVTVNAADGVSKTASCEVTVTDATPIPIPASGVTLLPEKLYLVAGGAGSRLSATVAPANAADKRLIWSTDNSQVATVSGGLVTPVAAGITQITVRTTDGGFTDSCEVNVTAAAVPVSSVTIPSDLSIARGGAATLTATILPITSTNKSLTWTSSDPLVATVSSTGIVSGIKVGTTTITATSVSNTSASDTCTVNVTAFGAVVIIGE